MFDRLCAWFQAAVSTIFCFYVAVLLGSRFLASLVAISAVLWIVRALNAGDEWEKVKAELKAEARE